MLMPRIFNDNLFDSFFDFGDIPARRPAPVNNVMRTDVKETKEGYELSIDLPGYKKDEVKAELKDGNLTVSAERSTDNDQKDENGRYIRRERFYGNCSRTFYVGEEVELQDIKAKFENGILNIFVPKKEAKPAVEENKFIAIEG